MSFFDKINCLHYLASGLVCPQEPRTNCLGCTQKMLAVANILFFIFHTVLIFFNVLGWMWQRTRRWNLLTLLATFVSWMVMGLWKGIGYCICTDWHWQIRQAMGIKTTASSYLVLLAQNLTGWDPPVGLVNTVAGTVFAISVIGSVTLNIRDWRVARQLAAPMPK